MKVLYDHQIFTQQYYGGISLYFCELMNQFSRDPSIDLSIALKYTYNENLLRMPQLNKYWSNKSDFFSNNQLFSIIKKMSNRNILNFSLNNKLVHINQNESARSLKHQNFDIFHPTYYNTYFLKYIQKKPYVLTVHDMIHELFPDMFKRDQTQSQKKDLIDQATKIIAVSDNTKRDIITFYDIDPAIIEVIPHGSSLYIHNSDITLILPQRYILFVGKRSLYKNFEFFIASISSLLSDQKDLFVICAGGGYLSNAEIRLIDRLNLTGRVIYYPITNDSILFQLYQKAIVFAFPSRYEGFGIPILEAFNCGCPVAASNCSSIPEVGGDAVFYFDPNNSDSIEKAIGSIIQDKELQDTLKRRGYERLKQFSWQKTAEQTKNVYEDILNENPHN